MCFQSVQIPNSDIQLWFSSGFRSWPSVVHAICNIVESITKRHGFKNHCYADDTHLHFSWETKEVDTLVSALIECTDELSTWMRSNRLKLNFGKIECSWIYTTQRLRTFVASTGARSIGVYFGSQLNLKQHISKCYQKTAIFGVVIVCYPPLTAVGRLMNSASGTHRKPAGRLQLVASC